VLGFILGAFSQNHLVTVPLGLLTGKGIVFTHCSLIFVCGQFFCYGQFLPFPSQKNLAFGLQ
jgi:hypothetical protein